MPGCSREFESSETPVRVEAKEEPTYELDLNPNITIVQSDLEKYMGEVEEEEDDDDLEN